MLGNHFAGGLATARNLGDRLVFPRIKLLADRFKWGHPFALQQRQELAINRGDPFHPGLSRKVLGDGGEGAVHVVGDGQGLDQE